MNRFLAEVVRKREEEQLQLYDDAARMRWLDEQLGRLPKVRSCDRCHLPIRLYLLDGDDPPRFCQRCGGRRAEGKPPARTCVSCGKIMRRHATRPECSRCQRPESYDARQRARRR